MKSVFFRKVYLVAVFALAALFLTSCDGYTTVYGIENQNKHKHKKHKKYDDRYDNHRNLPPGQHKKKHGDKSAKKYSPGHNKKGKKHKNH